MIARLVGLLVCWSGERNLGRREGKQKNFIFPKQVKVLFLYSYVGANFFAHPVISMQISESFFLKPKRILSFDGAFFSQSKLQLNRHAKLKIEIKGRMSKATTDKAMTV